MTDFHPIVERIKALLTENDISYETFVHEAVRTSQEAAAVRPEYTLSEGAKALIVRIKKKNVPKEEQKQFVQIVVPGDARFDPKKSRAALNAKDLRFALPEEVENITGGVQPGGVPPFGNLFGLLVYVDQGVLKNERMIFNAGDRRYSIAMSTADYQTVVQPKIVSVV